MNNAELSSATKAPPLHSRLGTPFIDNRGEVVSEQEYINAVAEIAQAVNRRVGELLTNSSDLLKQDLETNAYTYSADTEILENDNSDFSFLSSEDRLHLIETASIKHVIALADVVRRGDRNNELDNVSLKIAHSQFLLERLIKEVEKSFAERPDIIDENKQIILNAWSEAKGDIFSAVRIACGNVRGRISGGEGKLQIVVWNDIDQNLTEGGRHNDRIPAARYIRKAYQQYGRPALEPAVFGSIYDVLQSQGGAAGAWGRQMFREAGERIEHVSMIPGVKETFEYAKRHGIDMRLLTTTPFLVAEGLGFSLGLSSDRAYGRSAKTYASIVKPLIIMNEIVINPYAIHIVVDDGDEGLVKNIRTRSFPDGSGIQDHAFIVCKEDIERKYPLKQALDEMKLPYGVHGKDYFSVLEILKQTA